MRQYVNSGIRPLEGADCHAVVDVIRIEAQAARPRRRRGSRARTGRAREREHAAMMRRSSAGRYDGAPLMCRTVAGTSDSARPEQNVYSGTARRQAVSRRRHPRGVTG